MYSHRDSSGYVGDLLGLVLVLVLIAAFVVVKVTLFVVRTFVKYYNHRSLWIALAVCVLLSLVGILLATQVSPSYSILPVIGVVVLLIACVAVDLRNRDTFLRENVSLVHEVLHSSWFGSEATPRKEFADEQVAA